MKIRIQKDDGVNIVGTFSTLWAGLGITAYNNFRSTIERYILDCFREFSNYGYHYIGDWDTREECLEFIIDTLNNEFLNFVSPLTYEGMDGDGALFGLSGNPIPDNFGSTFISEISEDIEGTENKEKTLSKTSTRRDDETNTFEKDYDSKITYQEQNSNTKTNDDSVTSKETNSGSDTTEDSGSTSDTITYGKKEEKGGENWNTNEGSKSGNEQLERVPVNAITDDIKTPFSKGNQNGTHFESIDGGYEDSVTNSGTDVKDIIKENSETVNYGKVIDKSDIIDKTETEVGGNSGEKTIADTHLDNETKVKNSSGNDNETEVSSGGNGSTRDYRKSDVSKSIDDIIKSHEYLNKVRNYFYSIIFEWVSRYVDEYNTVY